MEPRLVPFAAFEHGTQLLHRIPHVHVTRVEGREAEAQDVQRVEVADDAPAAFRRGSGPCLWQEELTD